VHTLMDVHFTASLSDRRNNENIFDHPLCALFLLFTCLLLIDGSYLPIDDRSQHWHRLNWDSTKSSSLLLQLNPFF